MARDYKLSPSERVAVYLSKSDGACRSGWWVSDGRYIYHSNQMTFNPHFSATHMFISFPEDPPLKGEKNPNWAYMLEQLIWEGVVHHMYAPWLYKLYEWEYGSNEEKYE